MTNNKIIKIGHPADKASDLLRFMTGLPENEECVNLISSLYENFEKKNISERFSLEKFVPYKSSYGLLVGLGKTIAVFWHFRVGHFWIPIDFILFEHEAGFLSGSSAPIIGTSEIGICYTFGKGVVSTIARPRFDNQLLPAYLSLLELSKTSRIKNTSAGVEDSDDGAVANIQFFSPSDFSIF